MQAPVWTCMWVPALRPALGAASKGDRNISTTGGGGHPAVVVLEAGGVLGKPPWEMSLCLAFSRQGRELDLAAHVGTFQFCAVVETTLTTVGLFSGRVAFLLHHGPLLLPTVWFFLNGNDFKSSIRANKLPKVKTIETAFY